MPISFSITRIPHLIFGAGKIQSLEKELFRFGKRALIVTGKGSFLSSTSGQALFEKLKDSGISIQQISIESEPSAKLIDSICNTYKKESFDVVLGIGGGSVLDAGKAISAMLGINDSIKNYLEGVGTKSHPGTKIPFIAIPTTSGTGSETTSNAVISEIGEYGFKKSLRHPNFIPDLAIVDPELTLTVPKWLTGATGMDTFTQLLESYLSTKASAITDLFAIEGIKRIAKSLKAAFDDGLNLEARTDLAYASMLSGITIINAGLGTIHGFAQPLGSYFNIPHGIVCGSLMAVCNDYTVRNLKKEKPSNSTLLKYAEAGKIFSKETNRSDEYYIDYFIETLYELTEYLNIPKLSSFDIKESDFEKIIASMDNKNNPVSLSNNELEAILRLRL